MIRVVLRYIFIGYMAIWLILAAKDWFVNDYLSLFECLRLNTFWLDKYLNTNIQAFLFRELGMKGYKQFISAVPYIYFGLIIGFVFAQLRNRTEDE